MCPWKEHSHKVNLSRVVLLKGAPSKWHNVSSPDRVFRNIGISLFFLTGTSFWKPSDMIHLLTLLDLLFYQKRPSLAWFNSQNIYPRAKPNTLPHKTPNQRGLIKRVNPNRSVKFHGNLERKKRKAKKKNKLHSCQQDTYPNKYKITMKITF